jgi:hypothetical protein
MMHALWLFKMGAALAAADMQALPPGWSPKAEGLKTRPPEGSRCSSRCPGAMHPPGTLPHASCISLEARGRPCISCWKVQAT